ncbi:MAG: hypothetical protein MJE77_25870 [Proteobacteria bacterium]|nr:hypothetical protein [Pseudomonadota bacterium]
MDSKQHAFIAHVFRDITLALGGVFELHQPRDEVIWAITRGLRGVLDSYMEDDNEPMMTERRAHPAILDLLDTIDRIPQGGPRHS